MKSEDLRKHVSDAHQIVKDLIENEPTHRLSRLAMSAEWGENRFVAGRLLECSREEFNRSPRKSLDLARAAASVAQRAGSNELQFEAWRDCVSIFVRLSRFSAAWEAIDRAAAIASRARFGEFSEAQLLYARAYVASQPDVWRLDEALVWADQATIIFARADRERRRAAAQLRAYLHYCSGEPAAAVEICQRLWQERPDIDLALSFIAYLVASADSDFAETVHTWAAERISAADEVRAALLAWAEGRIRAAQRLWERAVDVLTQAADAFRRTGMDDTALRVELERIRAEVNRDHESFAVQAEAIRDLRELVSMSATLDRKEPTRRRRFTTEALDYLRELADASTLTIDLISHVIEYLDAINRGPAKRFIPPVPTRVM